MKKTKKNMLFAGLIVVLLVILDQITKVLAVLYLKGQKAIPIIKDVFELHYLENKSAAFGMDPVSLLHKIFHFKKFVEDPQFFLNFKMVFFIVLTIAFVLLFVYLYSRIPNKKRFIYMDIILLLFISGAIGNFIVRVRLQYVIDFFYFKLIDFPIFNVADIYVTVAAFCLIVLFLFYYKEADIEEVFPSKKKEQEA